MIIFSAFVKALDSLEEVLRLPKTPIVRDSAIQRFAYSYELAVKMLKRVLEQTESAKISVDELGFKDLIRLGAEKGFIADPEAWFRYREARNITSHAYDEKKAESIYAVLPQFATDAGELLRALQKANV